MIKVSFLYILHYVIMGLHAFWHFRRWKVTKDCNTFKIIQGIYGIGCRMSHVIIIKWNLVFISETPQMHMTLEKEYQQYLRFAVIGSLCILIQCISIGLIMTDYYKYYAPLPMSTVHHYQWVLFTLTNLYCSHVQMCTVHIYQFVLFTCTNIYCSHVLICTVHMYQLLLFWPINYLFWKPLWKH